MKPFIVILLAFVSTAHAQTIPPADTHATLFPCPNGPGVAVVAVQPDGSEDFAGCWGADAPVREGDYHREDHNNRTRRDQRAP
jgi:hypothetical protein